ncbi:MAG: hypothetical protein WC310_05750 [Patescibacteria group bacterium]|jgi:hypothetical protein|nr:hypothetical protein [Candidatus Paceibacterota bacterium]
MFKIKKMTETKKGEIFSLLGIVKGALIETRTLTEEETNAFAVIEKTIAEIETEG